MEPRELIAQEEGVTVANIDKRAHRHGWTQLRKAVVVSTKTITTRAAKQVADSVRPALQRHLKELADSDALKLPGRTMRHADHKASVLLKVAQTAKLVEGWGDMTESTINFSLIQDGLRDTDPDLIPPAIDVPSESMPTQSEPQ